MTSTASLPTLPRVGFETVPRPVDDTLPRMDVAGFVGFAASGPIDLPVLVEDAVALRDVFGPDPELARTDDGTRVRAHLARAVEAFFANGGKRAWVVRVAARPDIARGRRGAMTSRFMVPGLLVPPQSGVRVDEWRLATLRSRSPGSWSDRLTASATLEVTTCVAQDVSAGDGRVGAVVDHAVDVVTGDLVRITLADDVFLLGAVVGVSVGPAGRLLTLDPRATRLTQAAALDGAATAYRLGESSPHQLSGFATANVDGAPYVVVDDAEPLDPGDVVIAGAPADSVVVALLGDVAPELSTTGHRYLRVELATRVRGDLPASWPTLRDPATALVLEVQRVRLTVRDGDAVVAALTGLGLGAAHPRALCALPDDDRVFGALLGPRAAAEDLSADPASRVLTSFERECLSPRFPLGGTLATVLLPLGLSQDPFRSSPGSRVPTGEPAPSRDGLDTYAADLFVDRDLAALGVDTLLPAAWDLAYLRQAPRRLHGLHALATLDEISLVAVPDAVHTGWEHREIAAPPALSAPELVVEDVVDDLVDGGVRLRWSSVPTATGYELETDLAETFPAPVSVTMSGTTATAAPLTACTSVQLSRVRAIRHDEQGPWSNVVAAFAPAATFAPCLLPTVTAEPEPPRPADPPTSAWRARTSAEAEPWSTLLAVQSAVLRWCAARGDVLAALALPGSFTADDAARHVARLRGARAAFDDVGQPAELDVLDGIVPALTQDEMFVLGYGAAYHPWLVSGRPGSDLGAVPPEGAVLGTYAAGALGAGAWIAPARRQFLGALALRPDIGDDGLRALAGAQVNPVAQDPSGFMALTATTLSDVAALWPVNVRRLIALLRRLSVREGARTVFEQHDRELQQLVRMRFERILEGVYLRGGLAGATPDEAFDVSTGAAVNSEATMAQGRFVVEVRIAPSRPLEFLTVRLVLQGTNSGGSRL
ncbi:tail sheath protein [Humibacillus xanthopallidus]|uniref:Tail sheath protein n=1 Tax=Humibacillus xanthopallidus TaxID=412689 RepID=A0A543PWU2_9MICO|nr:hypothetical protein [Humibacillus xanthopallidus]TQN48557.1 tail sheath protein [Humibacillus xanthopallidus]